MQTSSDLSQWVVVMPSIRQINLEYLASIPEEVTVLVVDDSNGSIEPNRKNMIVYRYDDYRKVLGDDEAIIPRKTDTCRSFGFLMARKLGFQYVVTLDDDCKTHSGFLQDHAIIGQSQSVKSVHASPWYNTLDNLVLEVDGKPAPGFYARGVPYCYRTPESQQFSFSNLQGRVVCNMGMWLQVPDVNGLDKLDRTLPESVGMKDERLAIAPGTAFSLCIMNVGILAEAIPAFYQLPMNIELCGMQLDRFGDIWSGYILKRLADRRGDLITIGSPLVTHTKAGNTIRETQVEHFGHLLERDFYQLVDQSAARTEPADYATMSVQFSENFLREANQASLPESYRDLFLTMGEKMLRWAKICDQDKSKAQAVQQSKAA